MIQLIGIMIGAYIITRMVELLVKTNNSMLILAFAAITLLVTVICVFVLLMAGASMPRAGGF